MKKQTTQKINKLQLVKNWLLAGRTLTARQCSRMFGYDRLSDGIYKLKQWPHSMDIATIIMDGKDRFLGAVHYGKYKWLGEKPNIRFRNLGIPKTIRNYDFVHQYPMKQKQIEQHITVYLKKEKIKKIIWQTKQVALIKTNKGYKAFFIIQKTISK